MTLLPHREGEQFSQEFGTLFSRTSLILWGAQARFKYEYLIKELEMAVKLVVMYPRPKDIEAFENVYKSEHVPLAIENLKGKTKIVATKVVGSPFGPPLFHRLAEVHFPSVKALEECAASEGGRLTIAHALAISSGGTPTIFIAEEETFVFSEAEDSEAQPAAL